MALPQQGFYLPNRWQAGLAHAAAGVGMRAQRPPPVADVRRAQEAGLEDWGCPFRGITGHAAQPGSSLHPLGLPRQRGGGGDLGHLVTGRSELWATISCFDPRPQQAHIWTLSSGAGLDSLSPRPLLGALPPQQQGARGAPLLMRTSAEAGLLQTAGGDDSSGWASEAQPDLAPLGAPLPVVDAPRAGASRPPHSCALSAAGGVGPEPVGAVTGGGQVASLGPRCFTLRPFRMQHG